MTEKTRSSLPTLTDARFSEDVQFQRLWVELGPGACFRLGAPEGDCSVIEIEVAKDLTVGVPYNTDLKLAVALVCDDIESQGRAVDDLLGSFEDDDSADDGERITMVECVETIAREDRPTLSPSRRIERLDINCVNLRQHPECPNLRIMLVHPAVDQKVLESDRWLLEIKFGEYDLARRIPAGKTTLILPST